MNQFLQEIINWINKKNGHVIIGISGHGAAGKTTFAIKLVNLLKKRVNYINTDSYIVSSALRKYTSMEYTYKNIHYRSKMTACHPEAHHVPSLERDILMVKEGMDFYTIDTHYLKSERISSENKVTIVEGMSTAFVQPGLFDLKIYFYTDSETELRRRLNRDVLERGSDIDYLMQSHHDRRIQYELFMHPYSENFDVLINTSDDHLKMEKNACNWD